MANRSMGFHERLFLAWSLWQGRQGRRVTQKELGELLATSGGEAVGQTTVSGWFNGAIPDLYDICRLARIFEVDPGWIAFGKETKASGPYDPILGAQQPLPPP